MSTLKFSHISASYGHTAVLTDISLDVPSGKITTLVGPNGCGKTTLLQCLIGGARVTKGGVLLDAKDFLALPPRERAKRLAFLPQVRTVIPSLPVKTLVEHGRFPYLGFARKKTAEDAEIIKKAMEFTEVLPYAEQPVNTLSGGIRQRVLLAMILAQDSDIIVLDEPTTYLDLEGQRHFLAMLRSLRESGKTILLVLHDLQQAVKISDKLVVMNGQKIVAAGTPQECLQRHILEAVFHTTCKTFRDDEENYYFFE